MSAPGVLSLAVAGAHLSGQPLNGELTRLGARLLRACRTAPCYRLFALPGGPPFKPGLLRVGEGEGAAVEVEVWEVPLAGFGAFLEGVKPPLAIGTLRLEDGAEVKGFVCEPYGLEGAEDITRFGGWRAYLRSKRS